MLYLLASLAFTAPAFADEPAAAPPDPVDTKGPGRPVLGIGAGLRGGAGSAGFVTSMRVRVTPWFVVDPMVYVLMETENTVTTSKSGEDPELWPETDELATDTAGYGALALRFRVAQGRRASGWVLATGSLLSQDLKNESTTSAAEGDPVEAWQRYQALRGTAGLGFAGELWLRPGLTLSADAGFDVWEGGKSVLENDGSDVITTTSGFGFSPFAQLALHLYL